jgi:hypothetical protein
VVGLVVAGWARVRASGVVHLRHLPADEAIRQVARVRWWVVWVPGEHRAVAHEEHAVPAEAVAATAAWAATAVVLDTCVALGDGGPVGERPAADGADGASVVDSRCARS